MPKYFEGNREIPFEKVLLKAEQLTSNALNDLFLTSNQLTLCVSFNELDETCLGYIFNIRKVGQRFELLNITLEIEMVTDSTDRLLEIIQHVSGYRYSEGVQEAFQGSRNNIGSVMTHLY